MAMLKVGRALHLAFFLAHRNETLADIGEMVLWVKKLSAILRVNIMIYDYSGYGLNEPWGQDHCSEEVCLLLKLSTF
jgi:hypothetical protein